MEGMARAAGQYARLLIDYLQPQRRRVTALAGLLLLNIALPLAGPQIVRDFIDTARAGGSLERLTGAALLFLGAALARQVIALLISYLSADVGWTATNALRADLALHCLRLEMPFHAVRLPGELMERIDGDTAILSNFFAQFVVRIVGNAALLVGVLAATLATD